MVKMKVKRNLQVCSQFRSSMVANVKIKSIFSCIDTLLQTCHHLFAVLHFFPLVLQVLSVLKSIAISQLDPVGWKENVDSSKNYDLFWKNFVLWLTDFSLDYTCKSENLQIILQQARFFKFRGFSFIWCLHWKHCKPSYMSIR